MDIFYRIRISLLYFCFQFSLIDHRHNHPVQALILRYFSHSTYGILQLVRLFQEKKKLKTYWHEGLAFFKTKF